MQLKLIHQAWMNVSLTPSEDQKVLQSWIIYIYGEILVFSDTNKDKVGLGLREDQNDHAAEFDPSGLTEMSV